MVEDSWLPRSGENEGSEIDPVPGKWYPISGSLMERVPPGIRPWITDYRSMTKLLEGSFSGSVEVVVVSERWDAVLDEEKYLFTDDLEEARIREVMLRIGETPVLAARTVMPGSTFEAMRTLFAELGNRPLGNILFEHENIRRVRAEFAAIDARFPLVKRLHDEYGVDCLNTTLWARRYLFLLNDLPLLLTEMFPPTAFDVDADIPAPVTNEALTNEAVI